jgi:integrase
MGGYAMASIQIRKESNCLILDFYYKGVRCREQTALKDNVTNRKKVKALLDRIEVEIKSGAFEYRRYFPNSKNALKFDPTPQTALLCPQPQSSSLLTESNGTSNTPLLRDFANVWYAEKEVEWRSSHRKGIRYDLNSRIIPSFGDKEVGNITKSDILSYRADLAKAQGRGKNITLSNRRINKITNLLRQVVNEAADRFNFRTPFQNIKQLKVKRTDVDPFTLDQVRLLLDHVRADYRNYFTVRFFTGLRSGELNGLKWKFVDFERRVIMVRETIVDGEEEYTKNDSSQRDIQLSQVVLDALKAQEKSTRHLSPYVFCNTLGKPLDNKNVTNRVWAPLLRNLGLTPRRPYQCRHTAATLWLAAGENPEWIARQMGHTTTEMLFRVYSRYVPNLTRQDGSAFERLLMQNLPAVTQTNPVASDTKTVQDEVCHE